MKKPYSIIVFILIVILYNCTSNNNTQEISDEIVLKIGNVEITKYEFEKYKQITNFSNSDNKTKQSLLNSFIDNTYLVADALDKKYDTISEIKKIVDYQMTTTNSNYQGYLWNKVEEPKLKFSNSEIKEAYKKRNRMYYIEYLQFPNKKILRNILQDDTIVKSEMDFMKIVSKSKQDNQVKYVNQDLLWPFLQLSSFKDIITALKDGEITKPLYSADGIFLIHMIKTETTSQAPYDKEKENVEDALKKARSVQIIAEKRSEIKSKARATFNEKNINDLYKILESNSFRKEFKAEPQIMNEVLISYNLENKRIDFTIAEFTDYYRFDYMIPLIQDKESLISLLDDYIVEKYLYIEADKEGVLKDKLFIIDKRHLLNRMAEVYYSKREFENKIKITLEEKQEYYKKNNTFFTEGKICTVTFLTFKDRKSAEENYGNINNIINSGELYNLSDTNILKGLISYKPNIKIDRDNKIYPDEILQYIFILGINTTCRPLEYNGNYIVFFKTKEEGKRIKTFKEVEYLINAQLMQIKIEQMKNEKIKALTKKYTIKINTIKKSG